MVQRQHYWVSVLSGEEKLLSDADWVQPGIVCLFLGFEKDVQQALCIGRGQVGYDCCMILWGSSQRKVGEETEEGSGCMEGVPGCKGETKCSLPLAFFHLSAL